MRLLREVYVYVNVVGGRLIKNDDMCAYFVTNMLTCVGSKRQTNKDWRYVRLLCEVYVYV